MKAAIWPQEIAGHRLEHVGGVRNEQMQPGIVGGAPEVDAAGRPGGEML